MYVSVVISPGDDHEARRDERLAGDASLGIVPQDGVEDRVRDLVGDLVGVPLGHRLRGEEVLALGHTAGKATYWIPRNPVSVRSPPSFDPYRSRPRSGAVFSLATCGTVSPSASAYENAYSSASLVSA